MTRISGARTSSLSFRLFALAAAIVARGIGSIRTSCLYRETYPRSETGSDARATEFIARLVGDRGTDQVSPGYRLAREWHRYMLVDDQPLAAVFRPDRGMSAIDLHCLTSLQSKRQ